MSDNPTEAGAAIDQLKAERKRLATAKGLVTRERNKLARERENFSRWRWNWMNGRLICKLGNPSL